MANLDPRYIVGINLGEYFVDKNSGEPLAFGVISFFKDSSRNEGKTVYQLTGSPPNYTYTALPNPIVLSASGTIINGSGDNIAVYYFPYDEEDNIELYYISCVSFGAIPQFTREAWPNLTQESSPIDDNNGNVTNELSNSQFADVYFNPLRPYTYSLLSTADSFNFAPDWDLVVTGSVSSTVILERISLAGSLNAPSLPSGAQIANPAYALRVTSSAGITSVKLRQRLKHNPGIFSGGYLSGYLIAKSDTGVGSRVTLQYSESDSATFNDIGFIDISNILYSELRSSVLVPPSTNPQTADVGHLDILVNLPINSTTLVSAIQTLGMNQDSSSVLYDQQPINREQDFTFHNYKEQIIIYPKNTILTGWQFGVNPWQFTAPVPVSPVVGTEAYGCDNTIFVTEQPDMINIGRSNSGDNGSLFIEPKSGATQGRFAIVQYIDIETMRPFWLNDLSSLVRAVMTTNSNTQMPFKVDLIYSATAPSGLSPIAGFPVFPSTDLSYNAQWTKVPQDLKNIYTFSTSLNINNIDGYPYYSFNKFKLPALVGVTGYLAIVMYTVGYNFNELFQTGDALHIQDISLAPNEFAIAGNPESYDLSLRKCQYFYEKSWSQGTAVGTSGNLNSLSFVQNFREDGIEDFYKKEFQLNYMKKRISNSVINFYALDGTIDEVTMNIYQDGVITGTNKFNIDQWVIFNQGDSRAEYIPANRNSLSGLNIFNFQAYADSFLLQCYTTIDARLGLDPE